MKYHQADVVEINFLFPNGEMKPHPAIIISNDELQEAEGFVYLVLISSKNYNDEYSYPLTDEMISFKMRKQSYVKCQLITANPDETIIKKLGFVKKTFFEEIQQKIIKSIF
ncbi:type II toxin-antitoxin system PemK/MazF family toxin [Capnocytophaga canimorsus]|uniref:type II toxin-antitoxin system PemK/MazF family toxin n=1 Tax=Capnocytophaga canimorsus TaxID=28188 RepID=UPI0037CD41ED